MRRAEYRAAAKLLEKVIGILANPKAWTKRFNARDANGWSIDPTNRRAVCFCLNGAMIKAQGPLSRDPKHGVYARQNAAQLLADVIGYSPVAFNDMVHRRHKDVMKKLYEAYDRAIAYASM